MSYPSDITSYVDEITSEFKEYAILEFSFPHDFLDLFEEALCKRSLDKWIIDSENFKISGEELAEIAQFVTTQTHINALMKKGLVDGIEDETGEMVYFPTEKGRELNVKDI
jgi:hypothetical protein